MVISQFYMNIELSNQVVELGIDKLARLSIVRLSSFSEPTLHHIDTSLTFNISLLSQRLVTMSQYGQGQQPYYPPPPGQPQGQPQGPPQHGQQQAYQQPPQQPRMSVPDS
jgi:hypothetical protein